MHNWPAHPSIASQRPSKLFWTLRFVPALAAMVGLAGLVASTSTAISLLSGIMLWLALGLELIGWARSLRSHARSLAFATAAGALLAALALSLVGAEGLGESEPIVAHR